MTAPYYSRVHRVASLAALMAGSLMGAEPAEGLLPTARQNALVRQYCAVCHTDAAKNGGLSLEYFDAATTAPNLAAMLLSKLTGGVALETVRETRTNPPAAALVHQNMRTGAMAAAGIPIPEQAIIDGLIHALAVESAGATEWSVSRLPAGLTASILREMPSARGDVEAYRLIVSCPAATQTGSIQVAWSPAAQSGKLVASVDGKAGVTYAVEGLGVADA